MNDEKQIDKYYERLARETMDMLYDKGFIAEGVSREDMRCVEEYIAYVISSQCQTAIRIERLMIKTGRK